MPFFFCTVFFCISVFRLPVCTFCTPPPVRCEVQVEQDHWLWCVGRDRAKGKQRAAWADGCTGACHWPLGFYAGFAPITCRCSIIGGSWGLGLDKHSQGDAFAAWRTAVLAGGFGGFVTSPFDQARALPGSDHSCSPQKKKIR